MYVKISWKLSFLKIFFFHFQNILEKLESISLKYNKEKELNDKLNKELIGLNEKYTWLSYKNEVVGL